MVGAASQAYASFSTNYVIALLPALSSTFISSLIIQDTSRGVEGFSNMVQQLHAYTALWLWPASTGVVGTPITHIANESRLLSQINMFL